MTKRSFTAAVAVAAIMLNIAGIVHGAEGQTASLLPAVRAPLAAVLSHADDTPAGQGYLLIARQESEVARRQLRAALEAAQDVGVLRAHVAAALHALDPSLGASTDAVDYGLRPALIHAGDALHEAARAGANDQRTLELAAALAAARARVDEAVDFGRAALISPSPEVTRQAARGMLMAVDRAVDGWDRKGDGHLDWREGEDGLTQAEAVARGLTASSESK